MHTVSLYNAHEGDPQHEDTTRTLFEQLQVYIAEIGSVPWIAGGDWNIEPAEAAAHWERSKAIIHELGSATQSTVATLTSWL